LTDRIQTFGTGTESEKVTPATTRI